MIGDEVRRRRKGLGLTGAQLAARAGMAPSAVSQIETGKRIPSTASVIKLADALGAEVGDLLPKGQLSLAFDELAAAGSEQRLATLDEDQARALIVALWPTWLSKENPSLEEQGEARRFAASLALTPEELLDGLMARYPKIAREVVRQSTAQAEAERRFREGLEREVRNGHLAMGDAFDAFEEFQSA